MADNMIETLIGAEQWEQAQREIEKELENGPEDHWLWSRLSGVKYERKDYGGALKAAEKALEIVPDCPLALWSYAGALEMLGKPAEAMEVYVDLVRRGTEEYVHPDEDAEECWEGPDWTRSLVVDCFFRIAGCLAKRSKGAARSKFRRKAAEVYRDFIDLVDHGMRGIYTRDEAVAKLRELKTAQEAVREASKRLVEVLS